MITFQTKYKVLTKKIQTVIVRTFSSEKPNDIELEKTLHTIKIAQDTIVEAVKKILTSNNILLKETEEATQRKEKLRERILEWYRSLQNPGRTLTYTAVGLISAYTLYNIVRYGQLPFTNLLNKVSNTDISASPPTETSMDFKPVINITYPSLSSVEKVTEPIVNDIVKILNSPSVTALLVIGTIVALKIIRK